MVDARADQLESGRGVMGTSRKYISPPSAGRKEREYWLPANLQMFLLELLPEHRQWGVEHEFTESENKAW